jgi:peptidoglycan biosynthesis protein MviN/MurJ (putative lipid II flippase)
MQAVAFIGCGLLSWAVSYIVLSRLMFRSRLKKWEHFEDMMNEGCQTTMLLILSGLVGFVVVFAIFVGWLQR